MNPQIEQLRKQFNGYNNAQKKDFIDKLKIKLKGQMNPEYSKFLNECTQKYNAAIRGGATSNVDLSDLLDGSTASSGAVALENRIEQYKKAGYTVLRREVNSVKLYKTKTSVMIALLLMGGIHASMGFLFGGIFIIFIITGLAFCFCSMLPSIPAYTVTVSITGTGKIEETGNVLKK
jgi:hypothetical protein